MDVVRLIVEDNEVRHVADDVAEVHLGIRRLARGPTPEEVIGRVLVLKRWFAAPFIDPMDIRQVDVSCV